MGEKLFEGWNMKPIIVLPVSAMSDANIKHLRDNHICVVIAKNPAEIKFIDPIPAQSSRNDIENAAIRLSRKLMSPGYWTHDATRNTVAAQFVDILVEGTPLSHGPTEQEKEKQIFNEAKRIELIRLAKEEAKAEREAAKLKPPVK